MLHKCANPNCSKPFLRLDRGKLFQVETERLPPVHSSRRKLLRQIERYWLCDECAQLLTLTFEKGRGVTIMPLLLTLRNRPSLELRIPSVPAMPTIRTQAAAR